MNIKAEMIVIAGNSHPMLAEMIAKYTHTHTQTYYYYYYNEHVHNTIFEF